MGVEFVYFDIHGLGVMPRMVLAAGGVDFTDTRLTFPQWAEMKKSKLYLLQMTNNFVKQAMPLGQVPILKTEGLIVNQSNAIINWAVRNGDLPKLSCEETSKSDNGRRNLPRSL